MGILIKAEDAPFTRTVSLACKFKMLSSALLTLAVANTVNAKYSFDPLKHLSGVSLSM